MSVENAHTILIQIHGRWTANAQEAIFTVFGSNCRGGINAWFVIHILVGLISDVKKSLYTNRELEIYQALSKTKCFWVQINDKLRRNFRQIICCNYLCCKTHERTLSEDRLFAFILIGTPPHSHYIEHCSQWRNEPKHWGGGHNLCEGA